MKVFLNNVAIIKKVKKDKKDGTPFFRVFIDSEDSIDELSCNEEVFNNAELGKPCVMQAEYRVYNGNGVLKIVGLGK